MNKGIPDIVERLTEIALDDEKRGFAGHSQRSGRILATMLTEAGVKTTPAHERDYARIYNAIRFMMSGRLFS